MDSPQEETKKECCGKCSCGCQSGYQKHCCGGKALIVGMLFLLGGVIGYLIGTHGACSYGHNGYMMGMMGNHCPAPEAGK